MSAAAETKIWLALRARVETIPLAFEVVWPKQTFEPSPDQTWLEVRHLINNGARPFLDGDDPQFRQGILQIDLMTPLLPQSGEVDLQYAGQIAAHLGAVRTLFYDDVKVRIQRAPDVGPAARVNGSWATTIRTRWESFC